MTDSQTSIVPFGKYKGQPVEALAQDRQYCEWLAGQDWFRTRYTTIHTLIVNNFAAPHETPEHNALQVLFTDLDWVRAFVWAYLGPTWWADFLKRELANTHRVCSEAIASWENTIKTYEAQVKINETAKVMNSWTQKEIDRLRLAIEQILADYHRRAAWLKCGIVPSVRIYDLTFEQRGADVEFSYSVGALEKNVPKAECLDLGDRWCSCPEKWFTRRVECKPTLGDDYPAVLRQMIAHQSNVLLLGSGGYQGIGATYEQVKKMFGASGINIVLLADVGRESL